MAAFKGNDIFPQNPYHIPGYGGYVPQFTFRFGDTYGRTTHRLLLDPTISKSSRSLLAPLDNQENLLELHYHIDHPGYVTYQPIESPPEVPLGPQPVSTPALEEPMMTHMDPRHWQCPPGTPVPGVQQSWLPQEPMMTPTDPRHWQCSPDTAVSGVRKVWVPPEPLALHPAAEEMEREVAEPPLAGYAGFIPCITDTVGMTFIPSVNKAMKEFDRRQLLERNPPYTLGTRFPLTHWPDTKIYSRAGLIPAYAGHVPHLQDICGLTYGNGTRESYRCEQRRRGRAL
ncbi:protein FAM166A [Hirundo rustica]|uniref:protein FAM166A n=1 Tax=Hirundo rustica TaxID=43150 RepID=UPI001A947ECB|nr:protein FAM166A [Hirundo rustica]